MPRGEATSSKLQAPAAQKTCSLLLVAKKAPVGLFSFVVAEALHRPLVVIGYEIKNGLSY